MYSFLQRFAYILILIDFKMLNETLKSAEYYQQNINNNDPFKKKNINKKKNLNLQI